MKTSKKIKKSQVPIGIIIGNYIVAFICSIVTAGAMTFGVIYWGFALSIPPLLLAIAIPVTFFSVGILLFGKFHYSIKTATPEDFFNINPSHQSYFESAEYHQQLDMLTNPLNPANPDYNNYLNQNKFSDTYWNSSTY